ncbi:MAG: transposase, partial [Proteobacteria bacterium]|nr:transposase [Pseudomonadota bacterium]MBU1708437.1 transposase [Pseudomonadota bacterium]
DRSRFFFLLQQGIERYKHRIHAYCLMTNHVHLAIQVGETPLSRIIQNISFRYTRYMNHRKKQVGHLFQGRYKALLIDADNYLLELVRYIHNNPVRAGMAKTAETYSWSSHQAYLGRETVSWLTTDWVLSQFAEQKKHAVVLYDDFVTAGKGEGHRKEFHQGNVEGRILGEDRFAEDALAKATQKISRKITLDQVLQTVCEEYEIDSNVLSSSARQKRISEPRSVAALIVRETDHLSLTDLSRKLKRDLSGLSQAATRLEKRLEKDLILAGKLNHINALIK